MRRLFALALFLFASPARAGDVLRYIVVYNVNDEKLILMDSYGEKYVVEAHIYCWEHQGFERGDIVLSTENLDICVSSTLISTESGETCEVWCP